jgi:hypothetical protein
MFIYLCNLPNVRFIIEKMTDVSKAASLMGRRSAEARVKKWGRAEFERRMRDWGKLGGRPRKSSLTREKRS